jgi:hypothetical protein
VGMSIMLNRASPRGRKKGRSTYARSASMTMMIKIKMAR